MMPTTAGLGSSISGTYLFLAFLFGTIGMGYFMFGKKQGNPGALVAGVILMGYSYVITDPLQMTIIGICAMALPWIISRLIG